MSYTLLDVVKRVLSSLNGDTVATWNGSDESRVVSYLIEETFLQYVSNTVLPEQRDVTQLIGVGDVENPTHIKRPPSVDSLECIWYQDEDDGKYKELTYLPLEEFIKKADGTKNVIGAIELTYNNAGLWVRSDRHPQYWTDVQNQDILFDSYDKSHDASINASKTRALVYYSGPSLWTFDDEFVIPLDDDLMVSFVLACKEKAWAEVKEKANQAIQKEKRREQAKLFYGKDTTDDTTINYRAFGRK